MITGRYPLGLSLGSPARQRGRAAFTLTELLVVISIVAALLALAMPVLGLARKRSLSSRCVMNLKQLSVAVSLYTSQNNGVFPPNYNTGLNWYNELQDGPGNSLGANLGVLPNLNLSNSKDFQSVYNCPANPYRDDLWRGASYVYNRALGHIDILTETMERTRITNLRFPSKTILLADAGVRKSSSRPPNLGPSQVLWMRTRSMDRTKTIGFKWHDGIANFLMADGHVEAISPAEMERRYEEGSLLWELGP